MESKVFAISFSSNCTRFVEINNLPFLVSTSIIAPYSYSLAFSVFSSLNIKDLVVVPVDELAVLKLEDLEPS
jgi:hypothetical protein